MAGQRVGKKTGAKRAGDRVWAYSSAQLLVDNFETHVAQMQRNE